MPAIQRGSPYRLESGRGWGLRWRDRTGKRCRKSPFPNKSAALRYYRDTIEPELRGETVVVPELTLSELVARYLERHAVSVRPRTILELRKRLRYAVTAFGDVPLRDLERMSGEIASWRATLPERSRYGVTQALRQTLEAGCRWGYMSQNPAPSRPAATRNRRRARFASTRARSWTRSPPSFRRPIEPCPCSAPRPASAPRSGARWSAATSTAAPAC